MPPPVGEAASAAQNRSKLNLDGQLKRQHDDHEHQRAMLGQAAHFEVRKEMAQVAGHVFAWLTYELLDKDGDETDIFPVNVSQRPYVEPPYAIGDCSRFRATHRTASVRALAGDLSDDTLSACNSISSSTGEMYRPL